MKADRDRLDAGVAQAARGGAHPGLVERLELVRRVIDPAGDLEDVLRFHRALGLDQEYMLDLRGCRAGRSRARAESRGVVSSAQSAPLPSRIMLVATVVPWMTCPTASAVRPATRSAASMPSTKPTTDRAASTASGVPHPAARAVEQGHVGERATDVDGDRRIACHARG